MAIKTCHGSCTRDYSPCTDQHETFVGAVLDKYEENHYDDSDFVAVIWDGEKVTTTEYASTRGWTYHNSATIDATPEVTAAALAWYRANWETAAIEHAHADAKALARGKRVRSTTKRGKNVGIEGEIKWIGEDGYKSTRWTTHYRVGIKIDGEQKLRYVAMESVEVIAPDAVDEDAIRERAKTTKPANWRSAFSILCWV